MAIQKNQNIDRTSKHEIVTMEPGPYEAIVINNLDPQFHGALTVNLLKTNTSSLLLLVKSLTCK